MSFETWSRAHGIAIPAIPCLAVSGLTAAAVVLTYTKVSFLSLKCMTIQDIGERSEATQKGPSSGVQLQRIVVYSVKIDC